MTGTIQTGTMKLNGVSTDYNFPDPVGDVVTHTDMDVAGVQTDYYQGPAVGTIVEKFHDLNGVPVSYWCPNTTSFGSGGGGGGGTDGTVISDVTYDNVAISTIAAVTGLTGDTKDYTVVIYTYNTPNDKSVHFEFNGDTTAANYTKNAVKSDNASTVGQFDTASNRVAEDGFAIVVGLHIAKITGSSGSRRLVRSSSSNVAMTILARAYTTDTQWENTVDEITSLQITSETPSELFSGRIVVYEHSKIGDAAIGNLQLIGTETWSAQSDTRSFTGLAGDTDGFYKIFTESSATLRLLSNINSTDSHSGRSNVRNLSGSLSVLSDTTDIPDLYEGPSEYLLSAKAGADRPMTGRNMATLGATAWNTYNYLTNTAANIANLDFAPSGSLTGDVHLYKSTDGMFDTLPFELVETKVLSATSLGPAAFESFTGLTGDSEFLYKITVDTISASLGNAIRIQFNQDSTASIYKVTERINISSAFETNSYINLGSTSTTARILTEMYIYPNKGSGVERPFLVSEVSRNSRIQITGGMWDNTVNEITSLDLFAAINDTFTGTVTLSKLRIV